jgi:predicted enzyme related to lactoylglutathione lyase
MTVRSLLFAAALVAAPAAGAAQTHDAGRITALNSVTVFVRDYDEALRWYVDVLGFETRMDVAYRQGMRFVVVSPRDQRDLQIILNRPGEMENAEFQDLVGRQALWVFHADDCRQAYEKLKGRGVKFLEAPADQPWGTQAIFQDLYGNHFVLLTPRQGE